MTDSKNDIEMKDAVATPNESDSESLIKEIEQSFTLLHKAAANFDNRYITKIFRDLGPLRRKLIQYKEVLPAIVEISYPNDHPSKSYLVNYVGKSDYVSSTTNEMEIDDTNKSNSIKVLPEIDVYIHLLVQVNLLDQHELKSLDSFNDEVINLLSSYNRRSLDFIQAKIWFYISRTKELINDLYSIRPALLSGLRTATLRHDNETTASIITVLLRNYLLSHDVSQASNLVEKTEFPENAGNALVARYYYYLAKMNAIQLDYSSAHEYVIAAIRKAPQTHLANGFIQAATKLSIVIELLMGDIPELKVFKKNENGGNYEPYYYVTKAVKLGDLKLFGEVLNKYESVFVKDDLFTLVSRLRQNVIKTGIRIISLSYSKIALKDICIKLHLDSEESTEYIVAKAIRDGVIEATINHELGYMKSKELLDVYSTKLPQDEFDQRIKFCLSLHNDSVKSMRYPSDNDKSDPNKNNLEAKEEEIDLLKAIEEGDLDDFMD
ncbi:PCI-domain-containing protein [Hyphopichia burtonii NRRL Y-1933]|uniref:PCI-domain-containing protein n=1 Tax=Hyphopichia burtonii NRRL Y-1933 TaxID=984485 RepID=A0A1E4RKR1_9ASCO|nr:PCI-domain-containing protein [Hyphopichia burtonii NRRL Y-1933]ODV67675.1 PCI-domain-containing protein [Hyphopichia burtonii NRRL Y-1933]